MYSNGFASNGGNNNSFQQVIEWHKYVHPAFRTTRSSSPDAYSFMGSDTFCFKVCDPAGSNAANLCQHIFDRIGVAYNCPNAAQNGTFESCEGEDQDPPGVYTTNGQVVTYSQPPESLGPITSLPYTPRIPASSNCVQFASSALFTDLASPTTSGAASTTGSGAGATATGASASRSGSSSSATATGGSSNGSAATLSISLVSTLVGVLAAVAFLA